MRKLEGQTPRKAYFTRVCDSRRWQRSWQHCRQLGDLLRVAGGVGGDATSEAVDGRAKAMQLDVAKNCNCHCQLRMVSMVQLLSRHRRLKFLDLSKRQAGIPCDILQRKHAVLQQPCGGFAALDVARPPRPCHILFGLRPYRTLRVRLWCGRRFTFAFPSSGL